MADRHYRVALPWAVFGITVRDGRVTAAAPIAKWAIGKPFATFVGWVKKKGGSIG